MFKNVLVGVDGRPNGRDAIALATQLADLHGKLTLAHVHSGELRSFHAIDPSLAQERAASYALLEKERAAAAVAAELVSVVALSPGRGLHEQAEGQSCDLIVVGSCSHGMFGRAVLSDNTRAALNGAPCAVAVAPLGYADHPTPIAKIGVAYNASPESQAALAMAHSLAAANRATVHALEVVGLPSFAYAGMAAPGFGESIEMMVEEANSRMKELGDVEGRAVYGLAGEELAVFAGEVDLLIVGSRGYGPIKRLVLGSTSEYLQRHARCALLVLPRSATSEGSAGEHPAAAESTFARS